VDTLELAGVLRRRRLPEVLGIVVELDPFRPTLVLPGERDSSVLVERLDRLAVGPAHLPLGPGCRKGHRGVPAEQPNERDRRQDVRLPEAVRGHDEDLLVAGDCPTDLRLGIGHPDVEVVLDPGNIAGVGTLGVVGRGLRSADILDLRVRSFDREFCSGAKRLNAEARHASNVVGYHSELVSRDDALWEALVGASLENICQFLGTVAL
jgi:hypothetical protein